MNECLLEKIFKNCWIKDIKYLILNFLVINLYF